MLKPEGVAPEFTKSQEKHETFAHVSAHWMKSCLTYDQVMQDIETAARSREDIECQLADMTTEVIGKDLVFKHKDGRVFKPTDHALEQYAAWMNVSTYFVTSMRKGYKLNAKVNVSRDENDAHVLNSVLNNARRHTDPSAVRKFRTYQDGTLRAFLSDKYAYIDNRWYLETLNKVIPGGMFSHWRGDEDRFDGNILIPETIMDKPDGDTDYGGMINCGNNEIGDGRNHEQSSIFRAICMNGCIWSQVKGTKKGRVHRGKLDYIALSKDIYENITTQIPLFTVRIEQFLATQKMELDGVGMAHVIAQAAVEFKLLPDEALESIKQFNQHESSHRNLFGLINSITRAGQFGRVNELDAVGGKLVAFTGPDWNRFMKAAQTITDEKMQTILGLSA